MSDEQIDFLTLRKYKLRMKSLQQKRVDKDFDIHLQSWTNQQIKATKETGQGKNKKSVPIYKNFKAFFDYEKRMNQIEGKETKEDKKKKRLAEVAKRLNQRA